MLDPSTFTNETAAAVYSAGPLRDSVVRNISELQRNGWRGRLGPKQLEYYVVEDVRLDGTPPSKAEITTCSVSDGVVYDPRDPANPNDDVTVNDALVSRRTVWQMTVDGGTWKRSAGTDTAKWDGENRCPPKPAS